MNPLPPAYGWIDDLRPLPRMLDEARKLYGTLEVSGPANNPVILDWAKETGLAKTFTADAIPWCGLFMAVVAKRGGKAIVEGPLWARNWAKFGKAADQGQLGDVLVFRRGQASGHVGLYVGEDYGAYHVLGGNQSDGVTIIRRQRVSRMKGFRHWRWHLDEVYVKINGEMHYLWRAVDHEGEVLESYVTKTRDKSAALRFMRKALKRHGRAEAIVTDGLKSYPAAMRELGNEARREVGRHANNRAENSHLPFRRRERAMQRFRQMKSLQKFASVHGSVYNHFNQERHLVDRQTYKLRRSAALAEWQNLMA